VSEEVEDQESQEEVDAAAVKLEAEFNAAADKLKAGEGLTNEEGMVLLKLIGGVNANLTISNEILYVVSENLPHMVNSLADKVMRRCGRTDKKIRKSVAAMCAESIEQLWSLARLRALDVADAIRNAAGETNES
jgi:hypothetical protein